MPLTESWWVRSREYWATSDWINNADGSRLGHISFDLKL
jgi:hypothetical protein